MYTGGKEVREPLVETPAGSVPCPKWQAGQKAVAGMDPAQGPNVGVLAVPSLSEGTAENVVLM